MYKVSSRFFLTLSLGSGDTFFASAPGSFPPHAVIDKEIRKIRIKLEFISLEIIGFKIDNLYTSF